MKLRQRMLPVCGNDRLMVMRDPFQPKANQPEPKPARIVDKAEVERREKFREARRQKELR